MKNYTNKERQQIYEHLLTLDCPDLLASLIAQRADKNFMEYEASNYTSLEEFIANAFLWEESEEGWEFWFEIHECLYTDEYDTPTVADVIESTEQEMFDKTLFGATPEQSRELIKAMSTPDFESPTEADFTKDKKDLAKIYTAYPVKGVGFTQEKVSFWTKVKLFFGKWFYKV